MGFETQPRGGARNTLETRAKGKPQSRIMRQVENPSPEGMKHLGSIKVGPGYHKR